MRAKNATAGILVTDAFPKDKERLFQVDNIWVCTLDEFKSLCYVVRAYIIIVGEAIEAIKLTFCSIILSARNFVARQKV